MWINTLKKEHSYKWEWYIIFIENFKDEVWASFTLKYEEIIARIWHGIHTSFSNIYHKTHTKTRVFDSWNLKARKNHQIK